MSENNQFKLEKVSEKRKGFWYKRINPVIVLLAGFVVAYLFFRLFLMQIALNWKHYIPTTGKDFTLALSFVIPFIVFPVLVISLLFNKVSGLGKKTDSKYIKYRILIIVSVAVIIFLLWPK